MGSLDVTSLIAEVKSHLGDREDITTDRYIRALNLAQRHIARRHAYEETRRLLDTQTLVAGNRYLYVSDLPSDFQLIREIHSFRIITGDGRSRKLKYVTARKLDRLIPEPEYHSQNVPSHYTFWGGQGFFEFWPIPDQNYRYELRISRWPIDFNSGQMGETSILDNKDDIIIKLAVSWLFDQLGEYERARHEYSIANRLMQDAESEDLERPDQEILSDQGAARPDYIASQPWADPFIRYVR